MNINLLPFTILWMILSAVVVGLIAYRKWVAKDEDDRIHVMDCEAGMLSRQAIVVHKLDTIDHWGKTLTNSNRSGVRSGRRSRLFISELGRLLDLVRKPIGRRLRQNRFGKGQN